MRVTTLFLLGLSVLGVGCAAEDGGDTLRPTIGASKDKDSESTENGTTGSTDGDDGVAKPVTPADGPIATDKPATPTPSPTTPQVKTIACTTTEDSVTESYRLALQREPDPGGLQHWASAVQNGDTRLGVLQKIISSQEFASVHANLTDDEFVFFCYRSFFDREPDEGGRQGWLGALQGGRSRAAVATDFSNSEEFKTGSNKRVACYF